MRKAIIITAALLFGQAFFAQPAQERNEQDTYVLCVLARAASVIIRRTSVKAYQGVARKLSK